MDLWFTESHTERLRFSLKIRETLLRTRTPYQDLTIIDTYEFGKMMILDGMVMFSEFDEFVYHEMIVHVPMLLHPNPQKALVIGGGDGGSVREILRHDSIERVVLCEIDREVVAASRKYFPRLTNGLNDPKVEIKYRDAIEYVKDSGETFDIIIIDSTDPIGPSMGLFTQSFYTDIHNCLSPHGVVTAQTESFFLRPDHIRSVVQKFRKLYPHVAVYSANIPTYPTGYWSFTLGSKTKNPITDWSQDRAAKLEPELQYYNRQIHQSAFAIPNIFRRWING